MKCYGKLNRPSDGSKLQNEVYNVDLKFYYTVLYEYSRTLFFHSLS